MNDRLLEAMTKEELVKYWQLLSEEIDIKDKYIESLEEQIDCTEGLWTSRLNSNRDYIYKGAAETESQNYEDEIRKKYPNVCGRRVGYYYGGYHRNRYGLNRQYGYRPLEEHNENDEFIDEEDKPTCNPEPKYKEGDIVEALGLLGRWKITNIIDFYGTYKYDLECIEPEHQGVYECVGEHRIVEVLESSENKEEE
jgi:hypothetical protein